MKLGLLAGVAAAALLSAIPGSWSSEVASAQTQNIPQVPGDDIFGFTSPTDVGQTGDTGLASKIPAGAASARAVLRPHQQDRAQPHARRQHVGAVSLFGSHYRIADAPDLGPNLNRTAFDGLSFESNAALSSAARQPVRRQPVARTELVAARRGRRHAGRCLCGGGKLFVDAVVVPDRLYWAMNLNYAPGTQRSPEAKRVDCRRRHQHVGRPDLRLVADALHGRRAPPAVGLQRRLAGPLARSALLVGRLSCAS
jgi:hypothetical protein